MTLFHFSSRLGKGAMVALILAGVLVGCSSEEGNLTADDATGSEGRATLQLTATMETVRISAEFEAWAAQTDTLVKNVDAVFVGKVVSTDRTFSLFGWPSGDVWTEFTVLVEDRLLGDVSGDINVVQHGGVDPARNVRVVIEEDELIQMGETYLFASLVDRDNNPPKNLGPDVAVSKASTAGLHFIVAPTGHIRIESDEHRQQLIQEYTEAIIQAGLGS